MIGQRFSCPTKDWVFLLSRSFFQIIPEKRAHRWLWWLRRLQSTKKCAGREVLWTRLRRSRISWRKISGESLGRRQTQNSKQVTTRRRLPTRWEPNATKLARSRRRTRCQTSPTRARRRFWRGSGRERRTFWTTSSGPRWTSPTRRMQKMVNISGPRSDLKHALELIVTLNINRWSISLWSHSDWSYYLISFVFFYFEVNGQLQLAVKCLHVTISMVNESGRVVSALQPITAGPIACFQPHQKMTYTLSPNKEKWGSELSQNGWTGVKWSSLHPQYTASREKKYTLVKVFFFLVVQRATSTSLEKTPKNLELLDCTCHPYAGSHANLLCIVPILLSVRSQGSTQRLC